MCTLETFPAIKFFASSDMSSVSPPVSCSRVDKHVVGESWRTWAAWLKLARYLENLP